jgi:hypothetical protein
MEDFRRKSAAKGERCWWVKEFRKDNREKHEKCENEYPCSPFFVFFAPFAVNKKYLIKAYDPPMADDNPLTAAESSCATGWEYGTRQREGAGLGRCFCCKPPITRGQTGANAVFTVTDAARDAARNVMPAMAYADNEGRGSLVRNDGKNAAEIAAMKKQLENWSNRQSLNMAKGKTRKQIYEQYDNTLQPIAYLPEQYLKEFEGKPPTDNRIYCGQACFLDHAVNRHPNITPDDYSKLHEILTNPDEVIIDRRLDELTGKSRDNLLFTKKYGLRLLAAVRLENRKDGKILLHKSLYGNKKPRIPDYPGYRVFHLGAAVPQSDLPQPRHPAEAFPLVMVI